MFLFAISAKRLDSASCFACLSVCVCVCERMWRSGRLNIISRLGLGRRRNVFLRIARRDLEPLAPAAHPGAFRFSSYHIADLVKYGIAGPSSCTSSERNRSLRGCECAPGNRIETLNYTSLLRALREMCVLSEKKKKAARWRNKSQVAHGEVRSTRPGITFFVGVARNRQVAPS